MERSLEGYQWWGDGLGGNWGYQRLCCDCGGDAIGKQKSTIGKQREQGMSNGYEYGGQGGDVDMQAKQTGIYSFHYAHDVKSGSAEYKVESGSGDKNWSIETEEAPR